MSQVSLSFLAYDKNEDGAFHKCKIALKIQNTLAHKKDTFQVNVNTDASDQLWSKIVTQTPVDNMLLPHIDQHHEPLAFLLGHLSGSQLACSTIEKEAYAIMAVTT